MEIDLDAVVHNVSQFRELLGDEVRIMAVVKADAYGHGAPEVSRAALEGGASYLGVAFLEEGLELRKAGLEDPVLLMGYTPPRHADILLDYHLTPTVFSLEAAEELSKRAVELGACIPLHVKIDTGMGRVGLLPGSAAEEIEKIARLPGVELEGLMTHFATADEASPEYAYRQLETFRRLLSRCRQKGVEPFLVHAANSAASIRLPESRFNLVRPGISLYGYYPSEALRASGPVGLKPALTFKSRVVMVKKVPPGTPVSYGCTHCTREEAVIATVSAGYADGFNRLLSNRGSVLVKGKRVPVVGRVCMDYTMVDVTAVDGVETGDEVVLYGRQEEEEISVEEVAGLLDTISYEVLCAVSKRVPRLYFRGGGVVAYSDLLRKEALDKVNYF